MQVEKRNELVELTKDNYERDFSDRHLLDEALANCAEQKPNDTALIDAAGGKTLNWQNFEQATTAIAVRLLDLGFEQGDVFASALPVITEQALLYYGCLKIGALFLPLNPMLDRKTGLRAVAQIKAKAYAAYVSGQDLSGIGEALEKNCPTVETFLCFGGDAGLAQDGSAFIEGARDFARSEHEKGMDSEILNTFTERGMEIEEEDPALALLVSREGEEVRIKQLSHMEISFQNMRIGGACNLQEASCMIANQPAHTMEGLFGQITSAVFWGRKAVLTDGTDAAQTLKAVVQYKADVLIQDQQQYEAMWNLADYESHDLSSLACVVCTSTDTDDQFIKSLAAMAPLSGCIAVFP